MITATQKVYESDLTLLLYIKPFFILGKEENFIYFSFLEKGSTTDCVWNSLTFFNEKNLSKERILLVAEVLNSLIGPIHLSDYILINMLRPYSTNILLEWHT